jgi:superfamily II DNA/RNA helicase
MYHRSFRPRGSFNRFNRFGKLPSINTVHSYIKRASSQPQIKVEQAEISLKFQDFMIHEKLKQNIGNRGYGNLTPIQHQAIPAVLAGKDVIGIANTGTGKTAVFLVPLIEFIMKDPSYRALIITPTRELAVQIRDELQQFSRGIPVYSTICIGKSSMGNQIFSLKRNPHVVIGTPGRLKDLIERKVLKLSMFRMIVLDEVDRMLDMGFLPDVKHIISFLPRERQSLFFSATVSSQINTLINSFVVNPVTISVKTSETVSDIRQDVVYVKNGETKADVLNRLLENQEFKKVLVFGRTKWGVEKLSQELYHKGFKVASIHGDKPQFQRQKAIRMFREDMVRILVATDVAARGLDISNITHVINYDAPSTYEDYIHRIGRTGRANNTGTALTFIVD